MVYEVALGKGSSKAQLRPSLAATADPDIHIRANNHIVHLEIYSTTSGASAEVGDDNSSEADTAS